MCVFTRTHTPLCAAASIEAAVISMEEPCKRCRAAGSCITFTAWGEAACVEPVCVCVCLRACVCVRTLIKACCDSCIAVLWSRPGCDCMLSSAESFTAQRLLPTQPSDWMKRLLWGRGCDGCRTLGGGVGVRGCSSCTLICVSQIIFVFFIPRIRRLSYRCHTLERRLVNIKSTPPPHLSGGWMAGWGRV